MKQNDNLIKISIIVTVYETEQYLHRCIDSILEQSYKNFELIIVNDGSSGNVREIISEYLPDSRVKFIDNEINQGLLRARVCGAKHATGEYIAFVDSDDYISFDYYRTLLEKAVETNSDIVIGNTVWDEQGKKYVYNYHETALNFTLLKGEQVEKTFFGQELQCYSWHTIWNKLYKTELWKQCEEEFRAIDKHVVMTEDIYFSCVLFFNAKCVAHVECAPYFYCINENASTNANKISLERYLKNIEDIKYVFEKVYEYLWKKNASEEVILGIYKGKQHYARMWKNLGEHTFAGKEKQLAIDSVELFCDEFGTQNVCDDYFFESVKTVWNGGLQYIKEQIKNSESEFVSFDIFDTLIKRPFYEPKDIFSLLDGKFGALTGGKTLFSQIRIEAEDYARQYYGEKKGYVDITIDEIYEYIKNNYYIQDDVLHKMMCQECCNEIDYCEPRLTGVSLFNFAKAIGKRVILVSDMYLNRDTINKILSKCGIVGYEQFFLSCEERCLKYNGRLFEKVLNAKSALASDFIHIGDSWKSDIEGAASVGIKTIFFPKAIEVFENKIQGVCTNRCSNIDRYACGDAIDYNKTIKGIPIRTMKAMAANYYFDNPYRTFNAESDFNVDPNFIGYYLLGMHMISISKWLHEEMLKKDDYHLIFLARDGYLPYLSYSTFLNGLKGENNSLYVQASRKALMPYILSDILDLFSLPIEYKAHTPETVYEMLEFLAKQDSSADLFEKLEEIGMNRMDNFCTKEQLNRFINMFIEICYDKNRHEDEKKLVEDYYDNLPNKSITFDMGYSGRIQTAICHATKKTIDALFLHEDYQMSSGLKEMTGFKINSFYPYYPSVSGLIREHLFSDVNGSCIGFTRDDGKSSPVLEGKRHNYPATFVVSAMQNNAIRFIEEYVYLFNESPCFFDFSTFTVSLPYEGFLRNPSKADIHVFSASYFEDIVFGSREDINIEQFILNHLTSLKSCCLLERDKQEEDNEKILNMINRSSQIKRAIIWFLLDRKFFKEKFGKNIKNKFVNISTREDYDNGF